MLLRKRDCAARQPVPSPRGGGRRRRRSDVVTSERSTRNDAARGGARASSYCRSRQNALGLKEARNRDRSGRKPARYTERVNGSLTTGGAQARKRRSPLVAKGGRFTLARRSSSRERRASLKATWFRSCFGASGTRVATDDGRHPGSGMRMPFTRPRGTGLGGLRVKAWDSRPKRAPTLTSPEEATRVSEANGIDSHTREENALGCDRPGAEVGSAP